MSGIDLLVDTNILLYILEGNSKMLPYLESNLWVSEITEMELLGVPNIRPEEVKQIKSLLNDCVVITFNQDIKKQTISLKQKHKIKLPDAIIAATALYLKIPLLTADKGFKKIDSLDMVLLNI